MHTQFERLITLLDEEAQFYQTLLGCIQNEKQAIVDLDFDRLAAIGGQKERTLAHLGHLSGKRAQALQELCTGMALPPEELTLGQLSKAAPSPYGEKLQRCRNRLRKVLASIGDENSNVRHLVDHGLALVRGSYHMITQLLDANPVYHSSGNLQPAQATGRFHNSDY